VRTLRGRNGATIQHPGRASKYVGFMPFPTEHLEAATYAARMSHCAARQP
jgi:hypothetical protein